MNKVVGKIKCIFFDFDGVIVDSFDAAYKLSREYLREENISNYRKLFSGKISDFLNSALTADELADFFRNYEKKIGSLPIVPGVKELILELKEKYILAIISSANTSSINKFLETHEVNVFSEVKGYDDSPSKEEKIMDLMVEYQLLPDECMMITDTVGDVIEAEKAGVKSITVTWGYHDEETLKKSKPLAIVRTPHELGAYLKRISSDLQLTKNS